MFLALFSRTNQWCNLRSPGEEHVGPDGQDHQVQGDAHHVAGEVVL